MCDKLDRYRVYLTFCLQMQVCFPLAMQVIHESQMHQVLVCDHHGTIMWQHRKAWWQLTRHWTTRWITLSAMKIFLFNS